MKLITAIALMPFAFLFFVIAIIAFFIVAPFTVAYSFAMNQEAFDDPIF